MFLSWRDKKPSVLRIVTGAFIGLVAITSAAGFVTPLSAVIIGALATPISYYSLRVTDNEEQVGLDIIEYGERAY